MFDKNLRECLTFDDVMLVPAYSEVLPTEVDVRTRLTRTIELNIPIVSAAMDSVTEARSAIALARQGGIGIIHKNLPPAAQAEQVDRVKRAESAVILDPVTVRPSQSRSTSDSGPSCPQNSLISQPVSASSRRSCTTV